MIGLLAALLGPAVAYGDGGTLRLSQQRDGLRISVFSAPTPLRAGSVDFSVLVQDAAGAPLPDLPVTVHAHPVGRPEQCSGGPATSEAATNKLFRAAQFELPAAGRWRVEVTVNGPERATNVAFEVEAEEPLPAWIDFGFWIGWPVVAVLLFGLHQYLARRRAPRGEGAGRRIPGSPRT